MKKLIYIFLLFILCVIRTYSEDTLDSPILVEPPVERDVVINPNLVWIPVENAATYEVQMSNNVNFTNLVQLPQPEVSANHLKIQSGVLLPFTKYYWRVRAKNGTLMSVFSDPFNFRTAGTHIQELNYLKSFIVYLVTNNQFNQFKANYLLDLLNQTLDRINVNNFWGAITKLFQFAYKVTVYIFNGSLSYSNGHKMTDNSGGVIQLLTGDNTASNENNTSNVNSFSLGQNYPNPFNPSTVIEYKIPADGNVTLKIYNLLGEEVITLIDKYQEKGSYSAVWNAANLSSGIYIYRLQSGSFIESKKMILKK